MAETTQQQHASSVIPLDMIDADYGFNVRQKHGKKGSETYRGVEELAADMKRDGQITPVLLRPNGEGKFKLIAGFRRFDAAKLLGWTGIAAIVRDMDDLRAAILNAKENTARDGLTTYELAKRCVELRDEFELTQAKIAAEFAAGTDYKGEGMSRSYIGNLMRCVDKLHPKILAAWSEDDPSLTTDLLIKWSAMEHDDQIDQWNDVRGLDSDGNDAEEKAGEDEKGGARTGPRKATTAKITEAVKVIKQNDDLSDDVKAGMLSVLAFVLGKTKTIRYGGAVIYDPEAEKESRKESKKAAKEDEE